MFRNRSELGQYIRASREDKGWSQAQTAKEAGPSVSPRDISRIENGERLDEEKLENICSLFMIPRQLFTPFLTNGETNLRLDFEIALSEFLGFPATLSTLENSVVHGAEKQIKYLFETDLEIDQFYDTFNRVLVYYGIPKMSFAFFKKYFQARNFQSIEKFNEAIQLYQRDAIRLFSTFAEAYTMMNNNENLPALLQPLEKRSDEEYRARTKWISIEDIPEEDLPNLGYIAASKIGSEARQRQKLSDFLREVANGIRSEGNSYLTSLDERKKRSMDTLLRRFNSSLQHDFSSPLFASDPDVLEREAKSLEPMNETKILKLEHTQNIGLRNLAQYLSADFMDVYVATSMRNIADFISINRFVTKLFQHAEVRPLNLRYFNPTQSWIEDRVAKGLVEALMLKRSAITIYMAQKSDTFGKDSEASVALGQGKPVIVYVPKLSASKVKVDSEEIGKLTATELTRLLSEETSIEINEDIGENELRAMLLKARLEKISDETLAEVVKEHWADFDLYSEDERIKRFKDESQKEEDIDKTKEVRKSYRDWLDKITKSSELPECPSDIKSDVIGILIAVAMNFESRARVFKEVHPLALQVILSSGVLNGILVARSIESCALLLARLLQNDLSLELRKDDDNYRLIESSTGSTIRVISRNRLLVNAFKTYYTRD